MTITENCICGYSYSVNYMDFPKHKDWIVEGDEPFISIKRSFYKENEWQEEKRVGIMACPKCLTLKLS